MWKFRLPEEREFAGAITMKVCGHGLPDGMPAGLLGPYQQGSARHTASVAVAALDTTRLLVGAHHAISWGKSHSVGIPR